jgi:hypothetical protein
MYMGHLDSNSADALWVRVFSEEKNVIKAYIIA